MLPELRLSELLLRWEQMRLRGQAVAPEELCSDDPQLLDELRRRIDAAIAKQAAMTVASERGDSTVSGGPSASATPATLPAIPGYEVLDELGRGGMGVVYKVRNLAIGRVEALKMMRSRRAAEPQVLQRFQLEIRAMAPFEHPRIVRIYAAGQHEGQPYFTMEYVAGGSLTHHLDRYRGNPRAAVALLVKVARAVHYLHARNILHRDLKPANILLRAVEDQDEPLVSDFGLVKFFDRGPDSDSAACDSDADADSNLTQAGDVVGTTLYMSPEQAGGELEHLTAASDIWALGVILFELLTGRRPFTGPDRESIRSAIRSAMPPSLRSLQPRLDADLEVICSKCLAKDPRDRYASAAALADDLDRWLLGDPIAPQRWSRRVHRRLRQPRTVSAAMVVLLAGVALAFGLLRHAPRERDTAPPETLQAIRDDLAAGRRVTLIGDVGPPAWYRWVKRGEHDTASDAAAKPFSIHGDDVALVELLPADAPKRFRLRLEVHHHGGERNGRAGVYFAHSEHAAADDRPVHGFGLVSFNDIVAIPGAPPDSSSQVRLTLNLVFPRAREPVADVMRQRGTGVARAFPTAGAPEQAVWRTVQLDVGPEHVQLHWDDQALRPLSRQALEQVARPLLAESPTRPLQDPQFRPQDGLGLYVFGASAWFRACTIEPLPDPESN